MDNVGSDTEQMADLCHCPMRLVTMAGKEIETTAPLSIYHHWEMLELPSRAPSQVPRP